MNQMGAWTTSVMCVAGLIAGGQAFGTAAWDATTLYFNSDRPGSLEGQDIYATMRERVVARPEELR